MAISRSSLGAGGSAVMVGASVLITIFVGEEDAGQLFLINKFIIVFSKK